METVETPRQTSMQPHGNAEKSTEKERGLFRIGNSLWDRGDSGDRTLQIRSPLSPLELGVFSPT